MKSIGYAIRLLDDGDWDGAGESSWLAVVSAADSAATEACAAGNKRESGLITIGYSAH